MVFEINHERYGERTLFSSMHEAQFAIRQCGPEFSNTVLAVCGLNIVDQRCEVIGRILDGDPDDCNL